MLGREVFKGGLPLAEAEPDFPRNTDISYTQQTINNAFKMLPVFFKVIGRHCAEGGLFPAGNPFVVQSNLAQTLWC